jgi:hypothetical protein
VRKQRELHAGTTRRHQCRFLSQFELGSDGQRSGNEQQGLNVCCCFCRILSQRSGDEQQGLKTKELCRNSSTHTAQIVVRDQSYPMPHSMKRQHPTFCPSQSTDQAAHDVFASLLQAHRQTNGACTSRWCDMMPSHTRPHLHHSPPVSWMCVGIASVGSMTKAKFPRATEQTSCKTSQHALSEVFRDRKGREAATSCSMRADQRKTRRRSSSAPCARQPSRRRAQQS